MRFRPWSSFAVIVAAGALVKEHERVPSRTLWAGVPAKQRADVDDALFKRMASGWQHYVELGNEYRSQDDTLSDH